MLKIKQFVFGPFGVNTYIVHDTGTKDALVVDPGMTSPSDFSTFDNYIKEQGLHVQQIVNTHLHLDHCFGDNYVRDKYGVKVAANVDDAPLGQNLEGQAKMFGMVAPDARPVAIDVELKEGDNIKIGNSTLEIIKVPGHSPGSIVLYSPDGKFAIVGDVLFRGSIGRTDLPGGSHPDLISNIKAKLLKLPDDTLVLPGHDMSTTIGREKASNYYLM